MLVEVTATRIGVSQNNQNNPGPWYHVKKERSPVTPFLCKHQVFNELLETKKEICLYGEMCRAKEHGCEGESSSAGE